MKIFVRIFQSAYVIETKDQNNRFSEQHGELRWPLLSENREIRTTKFPRIGRSVFDSEERWSLFNLNPYSSSENSDEHDDHFDDDDDANAASMMSRRSVLFPRIGKRAFHNLLWTNGRSNPHRVLESDGRFYLNGYDYYIPQTRPNSQLRYRGKRNTQM